MKGLACARGPPCDLLARPSVFLLDLSDAALAVARCLCALRTAPAGCMSPPPFATRRPCLCAAPTVFHGTSLSMPGAVATCDARRHHPASLTWDPPSFGPCPLPPVSFVMSHAADTPAPARRLRRTERPSVPGVHARARERPRPHPHPACPRPPPPSDPRPHARCFVARNTRPCPRLHRRLTPAPTWRLRCTECPSVPGVHACARERPRPHPHPALSTPPPPSDPRPHTVSASHGMPLRARCPCPRARMPTPPPTLGVSTPPTAVRSPPRRGVCVTRNTRPRPASTPT
ncbi:hypothetical protein GGX14DRAFT_572525 [Mycena pura]|uniref:Uncharacterized protein n=1 Tax=Mycena pura TaxID=153505 RepID=A0AAD6V0K8_9AGAR|nr:hypothetical protein GGX14DRAFT_572525 [Mycena pura]